MTLLRTPWRKRSCRFFPPASSGSGKDAEFPRKRTLSVTSRFAVACAQNLATPGNVKPRQALCSTRVCPILCGWVSGASKARKLDIPTVPAFVYQSKLHTSCRRDKPARSQEPLAQLPAKSEQPAMNGCGRARSRRNLCFVCSGKVSWTDVVFDSFGMWCLDSGRSFTFEHQGAGIS